MIPDYLVCPVTRQDLRLATTSELSATGEAAGFVRIDGTALFPVRNGIPLLIPEASIELRSNPSI